VPPLRPYLQRRARPRAARVGRRGRADGRGSLAPARLSGGGGGRGGDARDADARGRLRPTCPPARSGRLLLRSRRRCRRPRGAARARRSSLARRARGPQHARDVSLRQRVGDAAAYVARSGDARGGRRRALGSAQPRSARRGVHRSRRHRRRAGRAARPRCSAAQRRSTSPSTATCSTRESWRCSCPSPADRRSPRSSGCSPT
jgi:hypothetical protein